MALFDEASPICRGKNLSWETVLLFFNNMPREAMPKAKFNSYVEARINAWTQTHSQIARQLAFYYEENGVCYPRFTEKTSLQDLFVYMQNWAAKYFIPNPYAPSLKGKVPTCIYSFIVNSINNGQKDFDEILDSIFHVKLSSHDKVNVYLSYFTNLLIDNNHQVSINEKLSSVESELYPAEEYATDAKKYYDYFTVPSSEIFDSNRKNAINKSLQQIFYGAPGTGKSNTIKSEVDQKNLPRVRTTFHPDSDYSTFVGAYKPTSVEVPEMTKIGTKAVPVENPDGTPRIEKKIVYEFVPQAFLKAYTGAWKNQDEPFFLIIEEINRGNCAQIFGDLFQLLDRNEETGLSDYPISPDEDIQKFLLTDKKYGFAALTDAQKAAIPIEVQSGELMILPKNLHIWATMNTSDQSLFPIDSAFKRRWDWQYMPISDAQKGWQIEANGKRYDWWQFLQKMNDKIGSTTNSEDKKLGYFFCKAKNGIIDSETFVGKVVFYIWNDVFKDYGFDDAIFKDMEDGNSDLSFQCFFKANGKPNEEKIEVFLKNLEVKLASEVEEKNDDYDSEESEGDNDEIDENDLNDNGVSDTNSPYKVTFPDGEVICEEYGWDTYIAALRKIGLEKALPFGQIFTRNNKTLPLITDKKIQDQGTYKYIKIDGYYVLSGTDSQHRLLKRMNRDLNLGLIIE